MIIQNDRIKGFQGSDVYIYDTNGKPFYFFEGETSFNLPKGKFHLDSGNIEQLPARLLYEVPTLPKVEKHIKMKRLNIKVEPNPNKASIDVKTGNVFFDEDLNDRLYIPNKVFILGHELGHNFYKNECKCDFFSAKKMLDNGFNPSQCFHSSSVCLGKHSTQRKEDLLNFLKKVTWK